MAEQEGTGGSSPQPDEDDVHGHTRPEAYRSGLHPKTDDDDVEGHLFSGAINPDVQGDSLRSP